MNNMGFELHRFTNTWLFFNKHMVGPVSPGFISTGAEGQMYA